MLHFITKLNSKNTHHDKHSTSEMKAILVVASLSAVRADQHTYSVLIDRDNMRGENSSINSEKYCNSWRNRMEEEGISAIKCHHAQDSTGRGMWACTPKWIRQTRGNDHKTIFMKYFITRFKTQTFHSMQLSYPEPKLIDVAFPLLVLITLVALCCCITQMDPPPCDDEHGLSFGDAFLAASLANSWSSTDEFGSQWGGEDFSYKTD